MLPILLKYQILLGQPVSRTECSPAKLFLYTSATLASFQTKMIWLPYLHTFLVIIAAGKFQGVIMAATPTGWRIHTISFPLVGAGMN